MYDGLAAGSTGGVVGPPRPEDLFGIQIFFGSGAHAMRDHVVKAAGRLETTDGLDVLEFDRGEIGETCQQCEAVLIE